MTEIPNMVGLSYVFSLMCLSYIPITYGSFLSRVTPFLAISYVQLSE